MKRLMNYLLGMVRLTIIGPFPERLINLCAQNRLDFWAVEWLDEHTVCLTARRGVVGKLKELSQRVNCTVQVEGSRGLPDFLIRFRSRYMFLVGLALTLCAVAFLSRFIFTIEVVGNEQIPTALILSQLRQLGVHPGVYGPSLERQQIAQEALLKLDGLAWMGINLHGIRLEVIVREAVSKPEQIDEFGYYDIRAKTEGIVTHVEAEQGDSAVKEGDTVIEGDILISGTVAMEPPLYSELPTRYYQTHARGRVWARTWRTLTAVIPVSASVKEYTGEEKEVWSINLLGKRFEIFGNSSIPSPFCDKITTVWGSASWMKELSINIQRETFCAYTQKEITVDLNAAQTLLEEQLLTAIQMITGADGQVCSTRTRSWLDGPLFKVSMECECLEEIGRECPGSSPIVPKENPGA